MKKYRITFGLENKYEIIDCQIELKNLLQVINFMVFAKFNRIKYYTITKM